MSLRRLSKQSWFVAFSLCLLSLCFCFQAGGSSGSRCWRSNCIGFIWVSRGAGCPPLGRSGGDVGTHGLPNRCSLSQNDRSESQWWIRERNSCFTVLDFNALYGATAADCIPKLNRRKPPSLPCTNAACGLQSLSNVLDAWGHFIEGGMCLKVTATCFLSSHLNPDPSNWIDFNLFFLSEHISLLLLHKQGY
jgi:hypothetical protein